MSTTLKSRGWLWVSFCLMAGLSANGRAEVSQILDSVNTHSNTAVLEMQFNDPSRTSDFTNTGILGTSFTTCERTAIDGIFCLDGNLLRHWPDSEDPTQFVDVIDCTDPSLGLDTKKPGACSGMTIESTGAVWFSGRKQGNAYSLFKAVEKSTTAPICPAGFPLTLTDYCVDEVVSDRNELVS
ncbi:MAG TPA: hypothetical protein VE175_05860, partial [Woeseiaceae bacterium]|nr:hypothetical protein [Woeseiaceae bacterium]